MTLSRKRMRVEVRKTQVNFGWPTIKVKGLILAQSER